jgi:DNA polymerase III delta subunit
MYYLLHGKDTLKSRIKLQATIFSFSVKNPHANIFRIFENDFNKSQFLEFFGGQNLFSNKLLIVCDNILKNEEAESFVFDHLEEIKNSPNVFVFTEDDIKKNELEKLEKYSEKVFKFDLEKKETENNFNIFSISDAFGEKNKKKLWIVFNKAKRSGMVAEEIFWKIVWQAKSMLLAYTAEKEGDKALAKLKISPFVLNKSKKYAKNFKESELKDIYGELVSLYHETRRKSLDFDLALESFILNLK